VDVRSRFTGAGLIFDESAKCSPAWYQRCFAASAQWGGYMIRAYRLSGFCFFLWVLFERFLLPIPMELAPPESCIILYCIFWTVYYFVFLLLFCLFWDLFYFINLAFRTHVSSCVRDGINHSLSISIILGCDSSHQPSLTYAADIRSVLFIIATNASSRTLCCSQVVRV
jgi:hypothetical protein